MTTLISAKLECEIVHILNENKQIVYADLSSVNEYDMAFKFNSDQLDCELEVNETFEAENKFKLTIWNIPFPTVIVENDIVKLNFYWLESPNDKYYTECVIVKITNSFESTGVKTVLEGTFLLNNILYKFGMDTIPAHITDVQHVTSPVCAKFGLTFVTNLLPEDLIYNIIGTNKSISMMLDDFCTAYNEKNNTDTCRWFLFGDNLVIEDTFIQNIDILYKSPIITYTDILKFKLVEETETKKSIEIEISGLPSLVKESFITIDYTGTPTYLSVPTFNETFSVTEVKHSFGTLKGFYSTIYCYLIKIPEEENGI